MLLIKNLKITDTAYGGAGVGRSEDGQVVFINNTVEGDIVNARVIEDKKDFLNAQLDKIIKPSRLRIKPLCPYSKDCGGCSFAHIDYDAQINIKENIIKNALRKYPFELPKINVFKSATIGYRLRVKAQARKGKVGFYAHKSQDFVSVENCVIIKERLFSKIKTFAEKNEVTGSIYAIENEEGISLAFINAENIHLIDAAIFDGMSVNGKKYGLSKMNFNTPYGAVSVNHSSFFQANRYLLEQFQERGISLVFNGLNIVELYAGAGFFSSGLQTAGSYTGCECDKAASELGKNLGYNIKNMKAEQFIEKLSSCDTLFLDPPREGVSKKVINEIMRLRPFEIIYVSCNPITLARDIMKLSDSYKILSYDFFDMYPNTYHIESIVKLIRYN